MPAAKKPAAKSDSTKKTATKTAAKKTPVKKAAAKKPAAKKAVPKKAAAAKKTPAVTKPKMRKTTFRVQRTEALDTGEQKVWWDTFEVPFHRATTVLEGLEYVKGQLDGTLTFRRSCRASICGSCGMFVNNRSRLACKTKIAELVDGDPSRNRAPADEIVITPQNNQPVLKDLVVDIEPFFNKVQHIKPFVQDGAEAMPSVDKTSFEQVNMVSNCIMCGLCYSDCTALVENPDYLGPAALAKAFRFVSDPREGKKSDRLKKLAQKHGVWDCTRCGMCIDACPKGVAPMEAIVKLRSRGMAAGTDKSAGARHAMLFKKDIATWGVLNEAFMLVKTMHFGVFGQIGNALNLVKKGKIPNPFPYDHKVGKLDEVKRIYQALEDNPINVETREEDSGPGAG